MRRFAFTSADFIRFVNDYATLMHTYDSVATKYFSSHWVLPVPILVSLSQALTFMDDTLAAIQHYKEQQVAAKRFNPVLLIDVRKVVKKIAESFVTRSARTLNVLMRMTNRPQSFFVGSSRFCTLSWIA